MIELDYYPLALATEKFGCSELFLIRLIHEDKLKVYASPTHWATSKSTSSTYYTLHEPVLIDEPSDFQKALDGIECKMYCTTQYPDDWLYEYCEIESGSHNSNYRLGVPITRDGLLINTQELKLLLGDDIDSTGVPAMRELGQVLYEIWINERKPEMKPYFSALKKYVNNPDGPITYHYTSGKDAGISYRTSYGTTGEIRKKTISNYVSEFKKSCRPKVRQ